VVKGGMVSAVTKATWSDRQTGSGSIWRRMGRHGSQLASEKSNGEITGERWGVKVGDSSVSGDGQKRGGFAHDSPLSGGGENLLLNGSQVRTKTRVA